MKKKVIFLFFILVSSVYAQEIYINEIFYDAEGSDNNKEFVEIFYDSWMNLTNFIIKDSASEDTLILTKLNENSNYALIVEDDFDISGVNSTIYTIGLTIGNDLTNTGDIVTIKNSSGTILDQVNYNLFQRVNPGYSLERLTINKNSTDASNWNQSLIINGTQGRINSLSDYSPPILNNLTEEITISQAIIEFKTNEDSNISISHENITNSTFSKNHTYIFSNLDSNTQYYYNITYCDLKNNCNLTEENFTTLTITIDSPPSSGSSKNRKISVEVIEEKIEEIIIEDKISIKEPQPEPILIQENKLTGLVIENVETNKKVGVLVTLGIIVLGLFSFHFLNKS